VAELVSNRMKSVEFHSRLQKECREGLMSLYLGYNKPLSRAERPEHLHFLGLEYVIPVLFRFRHELFAAFSDAGRSGDLAGAIFRGEQSKQMPWLSILGGKKGDQVPSGSGARDILADGRQGADGSDTASTKSDENTPGNGPNANKPRALPVFTHAPLSFSWLERKVLLHSPVADAVLHQLKQARSDEVRLRVVDNIETWNEYFNSGNREALELDILQLLSTHRYRHVSSEANSAEERLFSSRHEEMFWRGAKDGLEEYMQFALRHGRDLLVQLEADAE
jgi:hypothetical protein